MDTKPKTPAVKMSRLSDVPVDALRIALAFPPGVEAVRARRTSRGVSVAFDRLCWVGPADAARVEVAEDSTAEPLVLAAVARAGGAPLWLRMVAWSSARLLGMVSEQGLAASVEGLAAEPFLIGQQAAKAYDNYALHMACANGHLAIVERLALPPFALGTPDARAYSNHALHMACANGHLAVVERLTQPPFVLNKPDAQADRNFALHEACANGHLAVVERLAQHPFNLGKSDAQAAGNFARRAPTATSPSWSA